MAPSPLRSAVSHGGTGGCPKHPNRSIRSSTLTLPLRSRSPGQSMSLAWLLVASTTAAAMPRKENPCLLFIWMTPYKAIPGRCTVRADARLYHAVQPRLRRALRARRPERRRGSRSFKMTCRIPGIAVPEGPRACTRRPRNSPSPEDIAGRRSPRQWCPRWCREVGHRTARTTSRPSRTFPSQVVWTSSRGLAQAGT